jgi:hypothetical protein
LPQPPQLFGSVTVFALQMHRPPEQTWLAVQTWEHVPQLLRSVAVFAQVWLQLVSPLPQPDVHELLEQYRVGLLQAWPQEPQLFLSSVSSTQVPLQFVNPVGHPQVPALHTWLAEQAWPHEPQLLASVCVLAHVPEHSV